MDKLYEFEREPVSEGNLQPGRYFAGLFAGEHVAGTEFVIGAMFVTWGASVMDIFVGLALGNLLAVLSWAFICAPIATDTRLTLYWYLRRIAGPMTTTIYNVLNAVLFCILAGCMITVSASAVRIPFGIPPQTNWIPDDFRFVLVVMGVGAVVVLLAILGFKKLAQFASVCSPWMFLMFLAGGFALLPGLAIHALDDNEINSFADFWQLADTVIWTGVAPDPANQVSFWHVMAFAWICNLAMHVGLSDMALFRYARSSKYGFYSAFGMYLGHYTAWIAAGIMGAAAAAMLQMEMGNIDSGLMANHALGMAGIVAVVIAGWTTSNPTLYRAGLALQAITPGWPRWVVTLIAGVATTIIACSPFVFTGLLNFVGLYGLLLMPVGAIVFVEHWIFPKIGYQQYWAARKGLMLSWPALSSWVIAIAIALFVNYQGYLHLFFLFLPVWFLTAILYTVFAGMAGAKDKNLPVYVAPAAPKRVQSAAAPPRQGGGTLDMGGKLAGLVAAVCLLICLIWPLWIFWAGSEGYEARFESFKSLLIWPSIVYFVAGTWFAIRWDAAKR
jgi:NCS1 family nucleobase:cation symporter-1